MDYEKSVKLGEQLYCQSADSKRSLAQSAGQANNTSFISDRLNDTSGGNNMFASYLAALSFLLIIICRKYMLLP